MKTITISSDRERRFALSLVGEIPTDGTMEVIVKKVDKSSTAKQRGLYWRWVKEVSESGIGRHDTPNRVHLAAKWEFCLPILKAEDEVFGIVYHAFMNTVEGSIIMSEACKVFCRDYISTERLTRAQRARMLTEFQRKWTREGVNLSDPDDYGKNLLKFA